MLFRSIKSFLFSPLAVICFVSFVFLSFVEIEEGSYIRSVNRAFFVFFLIFILDLSSQTVSGSAYSHYLLIGIPALMVTLALAFVQFSYSAENIQLKRFHIGICFVAVFLAAVSMRGVYFVYQASVNGLAVRTSYQHELVNYVRSNSSSSEYVLVHGAETWILVGSERRSPTSISYIYPALQRFQSVYEKYIREIVAHKPVLIVETPLSCGLYLRSCSRQNDFLELKLFVDEYYSFAKEIHGYRIWRLNSTL